MSDEARLERHEYQVGDRVYLFCWPDYPGSVIEVDGNTTTVKYDHNDEVGKANRFDLEPIFNER